MTINGGARWRRRIGRLCLLGAMASLALAGFGTAAAQDEGPPLPDVFRASASSQVASVFLDRDALLPVNDAFRFIALDGSGTYESSNQTARASLLYPGNGIVSGPSLACGTFGREFPPEFAPLLEACSQYQFPLTVFADSLNPDGATTGSLELGEPEDALSARAVRAVAHAGLDASTTDAAIADLRAVGLPVLGPIDFPLPVPGAPELDSTVVTVDSARSVTDQRIDDAGRLVVHSEAVLEGIRLVGGLVEIDSIRSTATVVDDGVGGEERSSDLEVSGVTAGGVPARITDDGLVVGSPTGADGPLAQQLTDAVNQLLDGLGVEVTTLAVEDGVDESGVAFARSGGVLVEFDRDVRGLPLLPGPQGDLDPNGLYTGVILLGQAGATGVAVHIDDPEFTPGAGFQAPELPLDDLGVGSGGGGGASPAVGDGLDDVPVDSPELAAPSAASPGQRVVSVSEILASGRVPLVYLAFTLTALATCIGPRFILPARLPGSSP